MLHSPLTIRHIDAIAFTQAPGLIGCLLVGTQFAKSLALALNKPLIAVHHMQAHVLANIIPQQLPDGSFTEPIAFKFAEPQIPALNFSFSGLKTSILYFLQKQEAGFIEANLHDLCASIQHSIVTILLKKLSKAVLQTGVKNIAIAGGVSANSGLRQALQQMGKQKGWKTHIPAFEYCTDNAGMIAITGYYKYLAGNFTDLSVSPTARAEW
ncbi:MAG: hypothetical protein QM530_01810 [Phycisphaerales bacterium]|nr:hypothetical protein [Phycisphaerales bacterium]